MSTAGEAVEQLYTAVPRRRFIAIRIITILPGFVKAFPIQISGAATPAGWQRNPLFHIHHRHLCRRAKTFAICAYLSIQCLLKSPKIDRFRSHLAGIEKFAHKQ